MPITARDAIQEAATALRRAYVLAAEGTTPLDTERAQALTYVADSWTRLAEALDEHPRLSAP